MVTVLTFSVPFVTLAQQNALQAEAIADAEKDAAINVDTTRWFWRGCFGGVGALTQVYEPSPPACASSANRQNIPPITRMHTRQKPPNFNLQRLRRVVLLLAQSMDAAS